MSGCDAGWGDDVCSDGEEFNSSGKAGRIGGGDAVQREDEQGDGDEVGGAG